MKKAAELKKEFNGLLGQQKSRAMAAYCLIQQCKLAAPDQLALLPASIVTFF